MGKQQKSIAHLVSKNEQLEGELRSLKGFMELISQNPKVLK
jgi:hypothetical protein